jgi:hypothetical protein
MPFLALGRLALMRSCSRSDRRSSPRRGSYSSPPSTTPNPTAKPRTDQTDAMRRNHQRAMRKRRNRHSYKSAITAISSPYVTSSELQLARTITDAESERVASRLIRRGVSARSANSGRHQPRPAFDRSGLRRARRASGGDGGQVCGWLNPPGSARWDSISMCSPRHLQPARAGRRLRLTGKHTTGWAGCGRRDSGAGGAEPARAAANRPSRL